MKKKKSWKKAGKGALLALAVTGFIYSCKKIENKQTGSPHAVTGSTKSSDGGYDTDLSDDEVNNKVNHLVAVIWDNLPDQWDAVKPTSEVDAMDYMEAVLNYTHGNASVDNLETVTYHQQFAIPVGDDGNYLLNDYVTAFNTMSDYIVGIYNGFEGADKNVAAINLEPVSGAVNKVELTLYIGRTLKPVPYEKKRFNSTSLDNYHYDRVSGSCSGYTGVGGACVVLEDYGTWNLIWDRTCGGTCHRLAGYYSRVGTSYADITTVAYISSRPGMLKPEMLSYPIYANSIWAGVTGIPCIDQPQMNFYLDNIKPIFDNIVAHLTTKEFISLTVNPKYQSGGSFSNTLAWGNPNAQGKNTTGPPTGGGDIVTPYYLNAAGLSTYYEHYYKFEYGRYINTFPQPKYRKL